MNSFHLAFVSLRCRAGSLPGGALYHYVFLAGPCNSISLSCPGVWGMTREAATRRFPDPDGNRDWIPGPEVWALSSQALRPYRNGGGGFRLSGREDSLNRQVPWHDPLVRDLARRLGDAPALWKPGTTAPRDCALRFLQETRNPSDKSPVEQHDRQVQARTHCARVGVA